MVPTGNAKYFADLLTRTAGSGVLGIYSELQVNQALKYRTWTHLRLNANYTEN